MSETSSFDVISIGDANIDLLMGVPHHPRIDPGGDRGAAVRGTWYYLGPGGVAANVAAGMAQLGNRVGFIGVIGDDDLGRSLYKSLRDRGIDLRCVRTVSGQKTSLTTCFESSNRQAVHYACPGPKHIPADCLRQEYLASSRLLFVAGNMLTQDERTGTAMVEAMTLARQAGVVVALDPSKYWLNLDLASLVQDAVGVSHILLPNAYEAELLSGHSSPNAAARAFISKGVEVVAIKQGEAGCVIHTGDEKIGVPGFRSDVRSSLGAGDAFNSGFLHGHSRGWPLERSALFANAAAGLKVREPGTQAGLPSEAEVEAFLNERLAE